MENSGGALIHFVAASLIGIGNRRQDAAEARQSIAIDWREIRAAVKWFPIGCQKYGHRPAATPRHHLDGAHINGIEIRPFLTINFDIDEVGVEQFGGHLILEAFMRQDVTPMAGGIADTEMDRKIFCARARKSFIAPWIPVDRIMRMLQEVRAGFVD